MTICVECGEQKELAKDRLPRGWKRRGDSVYCQECWRARFVLRAVTIPVVGPVCTQKPGHAKSEPLEWPELRERLRESWIATTQASNFMLRDLALRDPGMVEGKLAKLPATYQYPAVRQRWPQLATSAVVSLAQAVQGKYRKMRLDLATYQCSLPTMRYPVPIPMHNATWSVWEDEGGRLLLSFLLGAGRVTVRLRGGPDYRRQRAMARQIIRGEAVQGELAIYRVKAHRGDHRNGDTQATRVMAKMVAWLPKDRGPQRASVAAMHTGGDAFLTMYDESQNRIFRWNRDDIGRRIRAHDDELQRLREDLKAEKRLGRDRDGILARMELVSRNQNHWLHTQCHQISKQVVRLLQRRRASTLIYVDEDKSYLPHFPWHKLSGLLAEKCEKAGITFASGQAAKETA